MLRRRLADLADTLRAMKAAAQNSHGLYQSALNSELESLRAQPRFSDRKCLIRHGVKVYSQCDEDGIILEIFRRIGTTNKRFVEFGVGTGLENNTVALLFNGWSGLWIDADDKWIARIEAGFAPVIKSGRLKVVKSFITKDNIDQLISSNVPEREIDLLSVDLDGNDYHILKAIRSISPRVLVMEYNSKLAPPIEFCMAYNASHGWGENDCFGASLSFLVAKLRAKGYSLVSCNLSGANAFFVRDDLLGDNFLAPYTAENHFLPARYHLVDLRSGHVPTYETLTRSLQFAGSRS